jgi:putative oxidoreductase
MKTQAYMASKGLPFPEILLPITILVLFLGGLSVLLGYKTQIGALLLIGFLIPATLIFHGHFPEQEIDFFKNLGLIGGLLMLISFGPGQFSLEQINSKQRSESSLN